MEPRRFLYCDGCGNLIGMIHDARVPLVCCGREMKEPRFIDIREHVKVREEDETIMIDLSFPNRELPQWVYLETNLGGQRKKTEGFPSVAFRLVEGEKADSVYTYFADKRIGRLEW